MKIAILGYDRQGKSAYEYWRGDNNITVCDKNTSIDLPEDTAAKLGDDYLDDLGEFDLLVRTPGLHPRQIVEANPDTADILDKVTTVTNEFLRVCPTKNIIGVTGTKGKGTTSTLIANMLSAASKRVHLGGNIGLAPLEMLRGTGLMGDNNDNSIKSTDWVVLELANFQLIDLHYSPHIAVCLMITPEHLDWHSDMDEYLRAKQQLFAHQNEHDTAIYKSSDNRSTHLATTSLGTHIPYMSKPGAILEKDDIVIDGKVICKTDDIQLLGKHNQENICAAVTCVWQITKDADAIKQAILETKTLPYRTEIRSTVDGVTFVNDSFATNPGATIAAIKAVEQPKTLLLGGHDRGLDFSELANVIADPVNQVERVLLFGQTRDKIEQALQAASYQNTTKLSSASMVEIVKTAQEQSNTGEAVVLSPACASFDMFKNFEVRGKAFNDAVEKL